MRLQVSSLWLFTLVLLLCATICSTHPLQGTLASTNFTTNINNPCDLNPTTSPTFITTALSTLPETISTSLELYFPPITRTEADFYVDHDAQGNQINWCGSNPPLPLTREDFPELSDEAYEAYKARKPWSEEGIVAWDKVMEELRAQSS